MQLVLAERLVGVGAAEKECTLMVQTFERIERSIALFRNSFVVVAVGPVVVAGCKRGGGPQFVEPSERGSVETVAASGGRQWVPGIGRVRRSLAGLEVAVMYAEGEILRVHIVDHVFHAGGLQDR